MRTTKWVDSDRVVIPREFQLLNKSVTLVSYILFVNGMFFLFFFYPGSFVFVSFKHIQTSTYNRLSTSLNKSCSLYLRASYNVEVLLMDMEFDPVVAKMSHVTFNTAAAREHVGDI